MSIQKTKNKKLDSKNWKQGLFISILGIGLTLFLHVSISALAIFGATNHSQAFIDSYNLTLKIIGGMFLFSIYIFSMHKYVYTKVIDILYIMVVFIALFLFILLFV